MSVLCLLCAIPQSGRPVACGRLKIQQFPPGPCCCVLDRLPRFLSRRNTSSPLTLQRRYGSLGALVPGALAWPPLHTPRILCPSSLARRGRDHCSSRTKSWKGQRIRYLHLDESPSQSPSPSLFSTPSHGARRRLLHTSARRAAQCRRPDRLRHRHGRLGLRIVIPGRHALLARCAHPQAQQTVALRRAPAHHHAHQPAVVDNTAQPAALCPSVAAHASAESHPDTASTRLEHRRRT